VSHAGTVLNSGKEGCGFGVPSGQSSALCDRIKGERRTGSCSGEGHRDALQVSEFAKANSAITAAIDGVNPKRLMR
jgi:hypothetical protein